MAELYPLQQRQDDEDWWPDEAFRGLGDMGYLGQTIPEEYGGAGLDYLSSGLLVEQMAIANGPVAFSFVGHDNLCANNIYRNGNEAQRHKYLPGLCSGEFVGALGMTEPGAGSDALGSMATTARREGDHYVLNGRKLFITNGPVADVLLVYAKTDKEKGAHGISAFIIEKEFPGFAVAQKLDKMGYRGSPLGELVFDDCRVPAENLLGVEDRGVAVMMSGLDLERAMVGPLCLGSAQRALDLAIDYAKTRVQFGKPIASFQMIQSKLGPRRDPQAHRRRPLQRGPGGQVRQRRGGADPRRHGLHARERDQPPLPRVQDPPDRRRHPGGAQDHHRRRAVEVTATMSRGCGVRANSILVMPGRDPGIRCCAGSDRRVKPGDDESIWGGPSGINWQHGSNKS
jgi:hypothetical protein